MVMGVQRSGTNVLRQSLSLDPSVAGFNEKQESRFFSCWYLRPEPAIREALESVPGIVLFKPISETRVRTVQEILEEYREYDLRMPWLFRSPVNVYYSRRKHWPELNDVGQFIEEWNQRNQKALDAIGEWGDRMAVVRYEDMITDPKVFWDLCRFLEIKGEYLFGRDSDAGFRLLWREEQQRILDGTRRVFDRLMERRRFFPRPEVAAEAYQELLGEVDAMGRVVESIRQRAGSVAGSLTREPSR